MEFHEKLQELRKSRGLTQEELSEALYVSRTAVSKWESGRGYPSIDSLKEISIFFSISIDDLLSTDKLLSIAEKENKANLQSMCDFLFGLLDIFAIILSVLPLYPNLKEGFVYSVNLFAYTQTTSLNRLLYWIMIVSLVAVGIIKLLLTKLDMPSYNQIVTRVSMTISILAVLLWAITRESYVVTLTFLLLVMKGILFLKCVKK